MPMSPQIEYIRDLTRQYDYLPYDASGGDNDRDGLANRADVNDGGGVDCSGWVWFVILMVVTRFTKAFAGVPTLALGSTSTYAIWGRMHGYRVPFSAVAPGDMVIRATNGDPENSDGRAGHVGLVLEVYGDTIVTTESSGSGQGVGIYPRKRSFWTPAGPNSVCVVRIPGMNVVEQAPPPRPTQRKNMDTVWYLDHQHTFFIDNDGCLRQFLDIWGSSKVLSGKPGTLAPNEKFLANRGVKAFVHPKSLALTVQAVALDGNLIEFIQPGAQPMAAHRRS